MTQVNTGQGFSSVFENGVGNEFDIDERLGSALPPQDGSWQNVLLSDMSLLLLRLGYHVNNHLCPDFVRMTRK